MATMTLPSRSRSVETNTSQPDGSGLIEAVNKIGPIIAAVLTGTNVLDVETIDRSELLRQQAVFAAVIRPLPNQLAQGLIHDY